MSRIICVIPARISSTRLPEKPLKVINGIPLIIWVYNNVVQSRAFDETIVATDDKRIISVVETAGGHAVMTSSSHASGTDRVFEVVKKRDCTHVVNVQGDEPRIPHSLLKTFSAKCREIDDNSLLTVVSHATIEDKNNPNVVKVVCNLNDDALYFSRSPIPYEREKGVPILKHIGMYGFTKKSLESFCNFPQGRLEKTEGLEQLRAIENEMRIQCLIYNFDSIGIDTPEELKQFRMMMAGNHYGI